MKTPTFSWLPFSFLSSVQSTFPEKRKKTFIYKHFPRFTLQNKYINFLFHIFSHTFYETKQGGERERISLFLFISFFLFFHIQISNSQILRVCGYDLMLIKMSEYEFMGGKNGGDEDWVTEWEVRLPSVNDLTSLSQLLISSDLASVFSILPEPYMTVVEVNRTSQTMFSTLHGVNHSMAKGSLFETTNPN